MADDDSRCQEIVELVTDYLEDTMADQTRVRFTRHLARCPPCVTVVEQFRLTIGLSRRIGPEDLSPDARRDLLDAFRGYWENRPHRPR